MTFKSLICFLQTLVLCASSGLGHASASTQKVLLVVAMDSEAEPIIKTLHLKPLSHQFSDLPMRGYIGQQGKTEILMMINGEDPVNKVQNIGTEPATLSTYLGIEYFHPDLVISIGTAGGVIENGAVLKDVYFSEKVYFVDRRIPMDGYYEYGRGSYRSAPLGAAAKKVGMKPGIICTEGSFDQEKIDYQMFLKEHCTAIDMEAAGVAWVSMLKKTPMIAIKGVSNYVRGKDIHEVFNKNLPVVTKSLSEKLKNFLSETEPHLLKR